MLITVSKQTHTRLKMLAFMRGKTIAEVTEQAIIKFLDGEEKKKEAPLV